MNSLRSKITQVRVKFMVGDLVCITKEKLKCAKGYEQAFSTEIIRVVKVIQGMHKPVYELSDMQARRSEG
jgi:hypothetical protein